ncbi:MAG: hypothetical protein ACRDKZ_13075, partial [Actinomycetota bacterium]
FTGAETALTAREAEMFEGRAGRPADSCYHLGCDDIDNVNRRALDEMSDAIAYALFALARDPTTDPSEGR